jgi:hypothetical protein
MRALIRRAAMRTRCGRSRSVVRKRSAATLNVEERPAPIVAAATRLRWSHAEKPPSLPKPERFFLAGRPWLREL